MRIGFFSYLPFEYGGGVAKYITEVSTGLSKRYKDLNTAVITFDEKTSRFVLFIYWMYFLGAQDRNIFNKESKKIVLDKLQKVAYHKLDLGGLKKQLQNYDVIYSTNNLLEVLLLKYVVGYRNLPPVIYGFHIPTVYPTVKSLQSKAHNMIYNSKFYINALWGAIYLHVQNSFDENRLARKFPKGKVVKIYNPFDFDGFEKLSKKETFKFNWDKSRLNILWVGRLTAQKGVDSLVELIETINASNSQNNIIWNIAGEGELKGDILDLKNRWDNVNYLGYVKNSYLPSIYKNNDIFISTSSWESFPYNILEAQSLGLPVVAFDIAGCNEIIDDGKNGYLVSDVRAFIDKIKYLSGRNKIKKEIIKRYIRNKFNEEDIFRELHKLFIDK